MPIGRIAISPLSGHPKNQLVPALISLGRKSEISRKRNELYIYSDNIIIFYSYQ